MAHQSKASIGGMKIDGYTVYIYLLPVLEKDASEQRISLACACKTLQLAPHAHMQQSQRQRIKANHDQRNYNNQHGIT